MKPRILITGVSGLLGNNLAYYFRNKCFVDGIYQSHPVDIEGVSTWYCDLRDAEATSAIISNLAPSIIIHCASLANIDKCEQDAQLAKELNVVTTQNVVAGIREKEIRLVYISTDAVYDGQKGAFSENDSPHPLNQYGQTKWEGEGETLKAKQSLVLRTNIFGWNVQNKQSLGEWLLDTLRQGQQLNGFKDACFSTIYTFELARLIDIALNQNLSGVYNCGSSDSCTKYEFAVKIANWFGLDRHLINPISVDQFSFKALRGKNLSLDTQKLQRALNYRLPTIEQSVEQFYRDACSKLPENLKKNTPKTVSTRSIIPYGRQSIDENDVQAVVDILRSDRLTQGPAVDAFEAELSRYCNVKHTVAVNSGTAALHLACLAIKLQPGDEVITSPMTFVASANCAAYCGATPVFADIDTQTYNVSPEEVEKKITARTKAIIPVHFAGQSCDMAKIHHIVTSAEQRFGQKIFIIEDACHALGSRYQQTQVGQCSFSDMAVMSFHPVKHITSGEGGAVLTNNDSLCHRLRLFRTHGITRPQEGNTAEVGSWYYEQIELGYNYRITDIQCGLGLSQMQKLPMFMQRRKEIVKQYNRAFGSNPYVQVPFEQDPGSSNFHLYILLVAFDKIGLSRKQFMEKLMQEGIYAQVHYIPVHTQPFYKNKFGYDWGQFPNAEAYYQRCVSLPLFQSMTELEVTKVINTINQLTRVTCDVSCNSMSCE
ncbi:UDP-4-amino-4,6-dideoxy-N-acetyl-beta-L-altrosamine transaminase [Deltaproteobacteria bacterium TL4]